MIAFKHEEIVLKNVISKEENLITNLNAVLEIVNKLMDSSLGLSLGQVANTFLDLQVIFIFTLRRTCTYTFVIISV